MHAALRHHRLKFFGHRLSHLVKVQGLSCGRGGLGVMAPVGDQRRQRGGPLVKGCAKGVKLCGAIGPQRRPGRLKTRGKVSPKLAPGVQIAQILLALDMPDAWARGSPCFKCTKGLKQRRARQALLLPPRASFIVVDEQVHAGALWKQGEHVGQLFGKASYGTRGPDAHARQRSDRFFSRQVIGHALAHKQRVDVLSKRMRAKAQACRTEGAKGGEFFWGPSSCGLAQAF